MKNEKGPSKITFQGSNPSFLKTKITNIKNKIPKTKAFKAFVVMHFLPEYSSWFEFMKKYLKKIDSIIENILEERKIP